MIIAPALLLLAGDFLGDPSPRRPPSRPFLGDPAPAPPYLPDLVIPMPRPESPPAPRPARPTAAAPRPKTAPPPRAQSPLPIWDPLARTYRLADRRGTVWTWPDPEWLKEVVRRKDAGDPSLTWDRAPAVAPVIRIPAGCSGGRCPR